ncbi:MAG: alanyl-tRNA synthetase [Candidatus Methanomethylophilaceae archaeon]|nr:alanyl-tRNA synthetase [Candidatus Methanomethylophilaceae archaeon]MDI3541753.1 alanyl-tRNA synthetase [Candidatus Methanomethylophilaceae archaeon]
MTQSDFDLEFFRDNGFKRSKCPNCGRAFWSIGDWETCGEPPCNEYSFIDNSPMKYFMNLHQTREAFLSFFEENGHTRIARYPIVARWRKDVFFTQASIYDFQPHVIDGTIEPPANPLTISQTCIRFNDIDNVGKTGRHFTFFEMLAHHVFNRRDREEIYFKSKTVELCHRFFTERLGTDPKRMRYIEEWWEGGGNSGPCLEVILDGVEVATLVFMMYRETPTGRELMDMQVVDTGYGLERISWVSQGTPSAYEAVFGPVVEELKEMAGIEYDPRIMKEYAKVAGMTNARTAADIRRIREETASRLGISYQELMSIVGPLEDVYVICDHSRALAVMLNDAVVPSNVQEGYFARLLVRRALRSIRKLGLDIRLSDIVAKQVDEFSTVIPEMIQNRDDILKLVDVEEARYHETLSRGQQLVERVTKSLRPGEGISVDKLIELYDSHGLNPEIVAEFADVPVEIPDDFYIQVAKRHETSKIVQIEETELPRDLPETHPIYYDDAEKDEFDATVLAVVGDEVVLNRTAFYPEGGGQEWDLGTIEGRKVHRVVKSGRTIFHKVPGHRFKEGDIVKGKVDLNRRRQLMSHHTAAHVINGVCHKMFGNHIWQAGANKGVNSARLDITHYENFSDEHIRSIEREANRVVMSDIPTVIETLPRDKAEAKYGFRLYQGGVVPGKMIRVVSIPGLDAEACGGLHVDRTGKIGPIQIIRSKRIQDGVVRIEYVAGMAAVKAMQEDRDIIASLSEELNVPHNDLVEAVKRVKEELRQTQKALDALRKDMSENTIDNILSQAVVVNGVKVLRYVAKKGEDTDRISKVLSESPDVLAVVVSTEPRLRVLVSRGKNVTVDCRKVLKEIMTIIGGKGGGKPDFAQGGGGSLDNLHSALGEIPRIIKEIC